MAHKKAVSSTMNGRDSQSKRLGIKAFASTFVIPGHILVRQKGNKYFPGEGVSQGADFTLFATRGGIVRFYEKGVRRFDKNAAKRVYVTVDEIVDATPASEVEASTAA